MYQNRHLTKACANDKIEFYINVTSKSNISHYFESKTLARTSKSAVKRGIETFSFLLKRRAIIKTRGGQ